MLYSTRQWTIVPMFRLLNYIHNVIGGGGNSLIYRLLLRKYTRTCESFNVFLPPQTMIGRGVFFPHGFPIVINPETSIGEFCVIHPCVLLGRDRGKAGAPVVGNNCFIGNGAKIIGNPRIGDYCFLSPGAIVTKDIPSESLVGAGINNILNSDGKRHVEMYQRR